MKNRSLIVIAVSVLGTISMSIRKLLILYIFLIVIFITGCENDNFFEDIAKLPFEMSNNQENNIISHINKEGLTIKDRYLPIEGYTRTEYAEGSFAEFLRNQKLKPYGEKVLYYDGREKSSNGIYDSVFDVDIGNKDLHQCADAIMLLRAEYLYSQGQYDKISFNFVSGFKAEYYMWMDGYRIEVQGNNVEYYKATEPSNSYEVFRKYMDMVFAYSGTLSLEQELISVNIDNMNIGDVFIVGGSPGHAVIVIDIAVNSIGEKIFLLAQSYMPAQQTQILINPTDEDISPWYSLKGKEKLETPQWTFELNTLKSWDE